MSKLRAPLKPWLDSQLPERDVQRIWRELQARPVRSLSRRRALQLTAAGALAALALGGLWLANAARGPSALALDDASTLPAQRALGGNQPVQLALSDGSRIALERGAVLEVVDNNGSEFRTRLRRGRGVFEVKPGGPRRWRIDCGIVSVEVLGTGFSIERDERTVEVRVSHGIVAVRGSGVPGSPRNLGAGQSLAVSAEPPDSAAADAQPSAEPMRTAESGERKPGAVAPVAPRLDVVRPTAKGRVVATSSRGDAAPAARAAAHSGGTVASVGNALQPRGSAQSTRALAAADSGASAAGPTGAARTAGDRLAPPDGPRPAAQVARAAATQAPDAPPAAAPAAASGSPHAVHEADLNRLLRAADAARQEGDDRQARALLERVLQQAPHSHYGALAALTLGRMQMVSDPVAAAASLRAAWSAGPPADMREDTLARLVEAYARAGRMDLARTAAAEYRATFPAGRRAAEVQDWIAAP